MYTVRRWGSWEGNVNSQNVTCPDRPRRGADPFSPWMRATISAYTASQPDWKVTVTSAPPPERSGWMPVSTTVKVRERQKSVFISSENWGPRASIGNVPLRLDPAAYLARRVVNRRGRTRALHPARRDQEQPPSHKALCSRVLPHITKRKPCFKGRELR